MTVTELPRPAKRWQPARAGILNVWRYYREIFDFHNGRLLLRGPNGTGKSKALELLLPFLFDASLRPQRLSTFGGSERTMHWNLMGEGAGGVTRVGYVWLEFTCESGAFTCGARLQASRHSTNVTVDYFTTSQRVGPDELLLDPGNKPLTRAELAEAIGEHGEVHASATDYRTAVRETLFGGLSEQRYDSLMFALLQLRTPKLSQHLDPELLSKLLSGALPPLGDAEISDLAEGFERLDRQREQLVRLDAEVDAAKLMAEKQQAYVQRILLAAAGNVTTAHYEMEKTAAAARDSEQQHSRALEEQQATEQRSAELAERIEGIQARMEGLKDSEAYREGPRLAELQQQATEAERAAANAQEQAEQQQRTAEVDAERAGSAEQAAHTAEAWLREADSAARRSADEAGMSSTRTEIATVIGTDPQQARRLLRAAVRSRRDQIVRLCEFVDRHSAAVDRREQAEQDLEQARSVLGEATEKRERAVRDFDAAVEQQEQRLRQWASELVELEITDHEELASRAESRAAVLEHIDGPFRQAARALDGRHVEVTTHRHGKDEERAALETRLRQLRDTVDLPPEAPRSRTTDRAALRGGPLWQLVDFTEDVPEPVQAKVEAALQAAGLLDAWLHPDGAVEIPGHDTFLRPAPDHDIWERNLTEVLCPESESPVSADRVRDVLGHIVYGETLPGEHSAAIGADGTWRLAELTGSWDKPAAEHIGTVARQRARERSIAELIERLTAVEAELSEQDEQLRRLEQRRRRLDEERDRVPDDAAVVVAKQAVDNAEALVAARNDVVDRGIAAVSTRTEEVGRAAHELALAASENALPTERDALAELEARTTVLDEEGNRWVDAHVEATTARESATTARDIAERSRLLAEQRADAAAAAQREAHGLREKFDAVNSTVGAEHRQVVTQLQDLEEHLHTARAESERCARQLRELAERIGSLNHQRHTDSTAHGNAMTIRDEAAERLRWLADGNFPADAGIELGELGSNRAVLEAARSITTRWPKVPHEPRHINAARDRLGEAVHSCRQALAERADLELDSAEDVQVLVATLEGVRLGAGRLLEALTADRDRAHENITAEERKLFDRILTGNTRRHLAERIRQANELVDGMNERLRQVRTASRMSVSLAWELAPDLEAGTKEARDLLLKDPVRLDEADKEALHTFLRGRIEQAKTGNTATSWEEQLRQVFDYTKWHRFVVHINRGREADTGWQKLTKKLHGALSGGEKAIALHLPLFAAVAAHYQAVPDAPRLILLDEVFVGVDGTNRGQVFGLLASLELDLMLTSDHEWCTYRELDGIAVHALMTGDGDDAVTTARFVWTGKGWAS
ncbi:uncharacterized protein (TIGR02680 family) [Halopolyspora algeriensis]|uniref:Uncharacterized protein (TIGR02680 family) n=1 Tax=Halopolyspora algeriensis TaxID=1500506 RepID=A0A368VEV1_9ACTN|nr:TIGR02680 family protein [Halopolyspora algeriensis]RCW39656.1 uncharacterized protein (TIGR02680 family) [Halopolyspora algeriensis]TQM54051.1 uncharacterized protein (TIGR02680 family) [Halopolyspora algeriensis]